MLPDYPKIKIYVKRKFEKDVQNEIRKNPLLKQIKYKEVHEGKTYTIKSSDGYTKKGSYKEISSGFNISNEEMIAKGPEALSSRVKQIADEMINQTIVDILNAMDEATERTGNIVNANSQPLSPDLVLAALDKVSIDFDDSGYPIMPAMVVSPEQYEKIRKNTPDWLANPSMVLRYKILHKIIIDKKRLDWIDRESSRKLVK